MRVRNAIDMDRISYYYEDVLKLMKVNTLNICQRQCMDIQENFDIVIKIVKGE